MHCLFYLNLTIPSFVVIALNASYIDNLIITIGSRKFEIFTQPSWNTVNQQQQEQFGTNANVRHN